MIVCNFIQNVIKQGKGGGRRERTNNSLDWNKYEKRVS